MSFRVDDSMLGHLDKLENSPIYYTRTQETFSILEPTEESNMKPEEEIEGGIYILKNFRQELLKLPHFECYSSHDNESHQSYIRP